MVVTLGHYSKRHRPLPAIVCLLGMFKPDGEVYAVKVIPREAVPDVYTLKHEVDILRRLNHHQVMRSVERFTIFPTTFFCC